jgi:hypothetical protein
MIIAAMNGGSGIQSPPSAGYILCRMPARRSLPPSVLVGGHCVLARIPRRNEWRRQETKPAFGGLYTEGNYEDIVLLFVMMDFLVLDVFDDLG